MAPPNFDGNIRHERHTGYERCEPTGENGSDDLFGLPELLRRHKRPLLWPAIGFLLGTTYPAVMLKPLVLVLLFAICMGLLVISTGSAPGSNPGLAPGAITGGPAFPDFLKAGICVVLLLTGYLAGALRGTVWVNRISAAEDLVAEQAQSQFGFVAVQVASNPKSSQTTTTFTGRLHGVMNEDTSCPGTHALLETALPARYKGLMAYVCLYEKQVSVKPGDLVAVKGRLSIPPAAKNPGEFDYRQYLMGKQIFLEIKGTARHSARGVTQPASSGNPSPGGQVLPKRGYTAVVHRISHYIETRIDSAFPGEETREERGILKALLLGDKGDLSPRDSDNFRIAGLYRFIAIAGFHVQLVAGAMERIFGKAIKNVHVSRIAGILSAFFLGSISQWAVGPLRAFLCVLLRHIAFWARRKYDTLAGFAACSIIIGWRIPYPLLNISLQLSFAGMLAGWIAREYTQVFTRRFELGMVRRSLLQSSLMAAFLLPLMATYFQDVSMAGFFLGGVWAALAVAVILSALPLLCLPLAASKALGWFPFFVVRGMRRTGYMVAGLPIASFAFPAPGLAETLAYLGLVFVLLHTGDGYEKGIGLRKARFSNTGKLSKLSARRPISGHAAVPGRLTTGKLPSLCTRRPTVLVLSFVLFASVFLRYYTLWPQVVFLSVGQGDCAVVRSKSSVIVVDTGTESAAKGILVPYLKREGVRQIDLCIISHLHADHVGGLGELCRNFKVETIMTCPGSKESVVQMVREAILTLNAGVLMSYAAHSSGAVCEFEFSPRAGHFVSAAACSTSKGMHVIEAGAGDVYKIGGAVITVIHPPKLYGRAGEGAVVAGGAPALGSQAGSRGFDNEDSLVIGMEFGGLPAHVEFWGDAPGKSVLSLLEAVDITGNPSGDTQLTETGVWEMDLWGGQPEIRGFPCAGDGVVSIVKVPHHGSPDSLVYGFYQRAQGGVAVISVGPNSYGHPSPDVIEAAEESGLRVLRTDLDGAVTAKMYPGRVRVSTFVR